MSLLLREGAVRCTRPLRVDHEAGIVYGVKVLGLSSSNGRRYLPEAIAGAISLYENVAVNVDHPERKPTQPRSAYDRCAWLEDVRLEEGELYADLHLLTTHPIARRVMEAAEKNPALFGLSHNAQGEGIHEGGVFVVHEITEVRHVDLVADPATTQSLCEGVMPKKKTRPLAEMYEEEELDPSMTAAPAAESPNGPSGEPPPPTPDAGAGDELDHLFAAFKILMTTDPEKANKILAHLKAEVGDEDAGDEEDVEPVEEEEDEGGEKKKEVEEECGPDGKPMKEHREPLAGRSPAGRSSGPSARLALAQELRQLRREKACRSLCESAGLKATETLVEHLAAMGETKARDHVLWLKTNLKPGASAPRSSAPGSRPLAEGQYGLSGGRLPQTADDQAKALLS